MVHQHLGREGGRVGQCENGLRGRGGGELGVGKEKEGKGVKLTRSIRKKRNGGREGWMEGVRVEGSAQDRLEIRYQRR